MERRPVPDAIEGGLGQSRGADGYRNQGSDGCRSVRRMLEDRADDSRAAPGPDDSSSAWPARAGGLAVGPGLEGTTVRADRVLGRPCAPPPGPGRDGRGSAGARPRPWRRPRRAGAPASAARLASSSSLPSRSRASWVRDRRRERRGNAFSPSVRARATSELRCWTALSMARPAATQPSTSWTSESRGASNAARAAKGPAASA
jgi:hypothetical protein